MERDERRNCDDAQGKHARLRWQEGQLERDRLDSCFNGGDDEDRIHGRGEPVKTYVLSAT